MKPDGSSLARQVWPNQLLMFLADPSEQVPAQVKVLGQATLALPRIYAFLDCLESGRLREDVDPKVLALLEGFAEEALRAVEKAVQEEHPTTV